MARASAAATAREEAHTVRRRPSETRYAGNAYQAAASAYAAASSRQAAVEVADQQAAGTVRQRHAKPAGVGFSLVRCAEMTYR
jgi:hypothetical protein